jgi:hypothetical protein
MSSKLYRPLKEQIGLLTIDSCYFSHNGVNFEIVATNVKPHIHTIKNVETGVTSDVLHTRLLALSET